MILYKHDLTNSIYFEAFLLSKIFRFFSRRTTDIGQSVCNEHHHPFAICTGIWHNNPPDFLQGKSRSSSLSDVLNFVNFLDDFLYCIYFSISQTELKLSFRGKSYKCNTSSVRPAKLLVMVIGISGIKFRE